MKSNLLGLAAFLVAAPSFACIDLGVAIETGETFPGVSVRTTAKEFRVSRGGKNYTFHPKVSAKGTQWCYSEGGKDEKCVDPGEKGKYEPIGEKAKNGDEFGAWFAKSESGGATMALVNSKDPMGRDDRVIHEQMVFSYGFSTKDSDGGEIKPKVMTNDLDEYEKQNGESQKVRLHHDMKATLQVKKLSTQIDTFFTTKQGSLSLAKAETPNGERARSVEGEKKGTADLSSGDYEGVADGSGCQSTVRKVEKQAKVARPSLESIASVSRPQSGGRVAPWAGPSGGTSTGSSRGVRSTH